MSDCESARFFRPWSLVQEAQAEEEQRVKEEPFGCSDTDSMRSSSVNSEDADQMATYAEGAASAAAHWGQALACPSAWPVPYGWMPSNLMGMQEAVDRLHAVEAAAKQIKKLRPKKYRCEYCNVAFSNNGQLKGHERIHTGERPYKCEFANCGKTFTRNEELTRHKRIHTGERPHTCTICRKSFGRKDHLKKHIKTHENRQVCQLAAAAASQFVGFHYPPTFGLPTMPYF